MNKRSAGDFKVAETVMVDICLYTLAPIDWTTPRVNCNVNYRLWMVMMCQGMDATLIVGWAVCAGGQEVFGNCRCTSGEEPACQCRRHKRCGFHPWVEKIPWRRKWQPTPVFFSGKSMDRGTWWATVHSIAKSRTWLRHLNIALFFFFFGCLWDLNSPTRNWTWAPCIGSMES